MKIRSVILLLFVTSICFGQANYRLFPLRDINSTNSEMAPVIYNNGIVFSSDKKSSVLLVTTDQNNNTTYNLYFAEKKGRKFERPVLLSSEIASHLNEASATFTSDSTIMYITRTQMANVGIGELQRIDSSIRLGIFMCELRGDEWVVREDFYYNNEEYDVAFPCLSNDGEKLYFASKAPEGLGGYDIYMCEMEGGSWSEPVNLGPEVNTAENEIFPFIHTNGRLYFSSKGHGARGMDIFYTEKRSGNWRTPIQLPSPFNSRQDDFGYVLSAQMDTGYFSSNRRGDDDDLYMFASGFPAFKECPDQVDETFCYTFSEEGSIDLDSTSMKYEWDFGDGEKIQSLSARHCYSEVGSYIVSLNVIDTLTGEVYFSEATYDLLVEPLEQPYITTLDTVRVDERFALDGKLSEVRSFEAVDYFWDFGDGNIDSGLENYHEYTSPGEYFIRLGITNGEEPEEDSEEIPAGRTCSQKRIVVIE